MIAESQNTGLLKGLLMAQKLWFMVHGSWFMVKGSWSNFGSRLMIHFWFMVHVSRTEKNKKYE